MSKRFLYCLSATLVVMLILIPLASKGWELQAWRAVTVSRGKLNVTGVRQEDIDVPMGYNEALYCSIKCQRLAWCYLWCPNPQTSSTANQCLFFNAMVMPAYQEDNLADAITCHTRKSRDLATGAGVIAGKEFFGIATGRKKANLVDGFYDYRIYSCAVTSTNLDEMWYRLDLHQRTRFQRVLLFAQDNINADKYMADIEVRVGNLDVDDGQFLEYNHFGFFPGRASRAQVVELKVPEFVQARFISIKAFAGERLQICHIEVY